MTINRMLISLVLLFSSTFCATVSASTIEQIDFDQLISTANFVFEGEAISERSAWNQQKTSIHTEVTFRIDDILKGNHPQPTITLRFAGGIVGDQGIRISSMVYPDMGEQGIYFVEKKNGNLVNPLVGWSQGHFLIEKDDNNVERILTEDRALLIEVEPTANNKSSSNAIAIQPMAISKGIVRGVKTGEQVKKSDTNKKNKLRGAVKKNTFTATIKTRLLNQPANN